MRFIGHGHPSVRATHGKTLEFALDVELTERGTCIVAVGVRAEAPMAQAGPIRITITAGDQTFSLDADANSSWDPTGAVVIRRGPMRLPGTFAINASAAANDLPPSLVTALQQDGAPVEILIEPRPSPSTLVLAALDPRARIDDRLAAELAAADVVVAEDSGVAALGRSGGQAPQPITGRVLVLASHDLPGRSVSRVGARVETLGLVPALAAAVAAPWNGPIVVGSDAELLRRAPAGTRLVLECGPDPSDLLAQAARIRGTSQAVIARAWADPVLVSVDEAARVPGADRLFVCLGPGDTGLDPAVRAAIEGLLTDGTPTKTAANALAALTGWPRRRAYDTVLDLASGGLTSGDAPLAARTPGSGSPRPSP